jgi:hypothetical protein
MLHLQALFLVAIVDICDDVEPDDVEPVSCGSVMPVTDQYNTFCL